MSDDEEYKELLINKDEEKSDDGMELSIVSFAL